MSPRRFVSAALPAIAMLSIAPASRAQVCPPPIFQQECQQAHQEIFDGGAWDAAAALNGGGICSCEQATADRCLRELTSDGRTVDDIFRTSDGKTAQDLINLAHPEAGPPSIAFGKLVTAYPGCAMGNSRQCNGFYDESGGTANRECPACCAACSIPMPGVTGQQQDLSLIAAHVNELDWAYANPVRVRDWPDPTVGADGGFIDAGGVCPPWNGDNAPAYDNGGTTLWTCDGEQVNYKPWEAMVFDLGGPANKVVLFPVNDHGPQPCESIEYTVYLTNNPFARSVINDPTSTGSDPNQWNRAKLTTIFLHGWTDLRNIATQDMPGCGDILTVGADGGLTSPSFTVEVDSFTSVWSLPCGISFRYVGVIAGNDGRDYAHCRFDSYDAELDAVIGLSEEGKAVCPDKDGDGYVDCACPTAPPVCDCDDNDPNTHPNAPEACDAPKDYNCNGHHPEPCPPGLTCYDSICLPSCGKEIQCAAGSTCTTTDAGEFVCVPTDCTVGMCPPGTTCDPKTKKCLPDCTNVVCPAGEKCVTGECVDLCKNAQCPSGWTCNAGVCAPPCACFAGDVGCDGGTKCDRPVADAGTNQCVLPDCVGVECPPGQHCDMGMCVGYCNGVVCPPNQVCVPPTGVDGGAYGCVNLCASVTCPDDKVCDSKTGTCTGMMPPPSDGGITQPDATIDDGGGGFVDGSGEAGSGDNSFGNPGGCSCNVGDAGGGGASLALLAGIGLAVATFRGRQRES